MFLWHFGAAFVPACVLVSSVQSLKTTWTYKKPGSAWAPPWSFATENISLVALPLAETPTFNSSTCPRSSFSQCSQRSKSQLRQTYIRMLFMWSQRPAAQPRIYLCLAIHMILFGQTVWLCKAFLLTLRRQRAGCQSICPSLYYGIVLQFSIQLLKSIFKALCPLILGSSCAYSPAMSKRKRRKQQLQNQEKEWISWCQPPWFFIDVSAMLHLAGVLCRCSQQNGCC